MWMQAYLNRKEESFGIQSATMRWLDIIVVLSLYGYVIYHACDDEGWFVDGRTYEGFDDNDE
jgi:hypothetical protein